MSNRAKVSIIGAGNVGSTLAFKILEEELAEVVLVDIKEDLARGKALDLQDAMAVLEKEAIISASGDYGKIEGSKIVVITAGLPRRPGMDREDLLFKNAQIVKEVVKNIKEKAPHSIILVVTNPLDIMTYLAYKMSGFDKRRVLGMAGVLDSARLSVILSRLINRQTSSISSLILGTHGNSMVPVRSQITVDKRPLDEFLDDKRISEAFEDSKNQGSKIVSLLKGGSAYYAPAMSVFKMLDVILNNKKEVLPASVYLEGEYGLNNICLGVPVKLDEEGIEKIIQLDLLDEEKEALHKAADIVKSNISRLQFAD